MDFGGDCSPLANIPREAQRVMLDQVKHVFAGLGQSRDRKLLIVAGDPKRQRPELIHIPFVAHHFIVVIESIFSIIRGKRRIS